MSRTAITLNFKLLSLVSDPLVPDKAGQSRGSLVLDFGI